MPAKKQDAITRSFLTFASEASNLLHIKTKQDYSDALETIEHLFNEATDELDEPLNDLIGLISRAIEKYESSQDDIASFHKEASAIDEDDLPLSTVEEKRWKDTLKALESVRDGKVVYGDRVHEWLESWGADNEPDPLKH